MEMEQYPLKYIDNDVWKVIQNGNLKKRISTGKDGVVRILPPVSAAEIHAVEKERKVRTILIMAIPKEHLRRFHELDRFKRNLGSHEGLGVPHPLTRDYTLKPQEEINDSLYVYGKKGPQKPKISDSDDNSTEHSTCQSNNSEGSFRNPLSHDSESESKENSSLLIECIRLNCDYYEKKMAREAEFKKQRVFNTGNRVAKPVWTNANRDHPLQDIERTNEADKDEELIVMPIEIKHSASKVGPRKSYTNSKEEKSLTELQNLQTQEKEAFSTGISEDTPETLAFRRDLDQLAQKHLREITTDKATSTNSVNSGSEPANTQAADQDDSDMPELTIFNKP
ncbi:hypothetical protein Tco_0417618 [Tanacetum coccineum]